MEIYENQFYIMYIVLMIFSALYDEIKQFREACGDAHMKTILAVGELGTFTNVYKASLVSMMAGQTKALIFANLAGIIRIFHRWLQSNNVNEHY